MTVKELIEQLKELPQNFEAGYIWDGALLSDVRYVWVTRENTVALSDGDVVYNTCDRPKSAPTSGKNPYWTPK